MGWCSTRWTSGASATRRPISRPGDHEKLVEGYYNFQISEKLRLSFHLQHVLETPAAATSVRLSSCLASVCRRDSSGSIEVRRNNHGQRKTFLIVLAAAVVGRRRERWPAHALRAADVKVTDPTSVVMIVNRDSNEIAFMDIKTKKIVGKTFLGNNVNPHMVMMSPDGRYVVTGGTRANKAYIIDARTLQLVKVIPVDIAPEHLAFSPDGRWYYQGNPEGDSISVIDMVSLTKIKTIPGLVEPLNTCSCRTARRRTSATTARTGSASSTCGATSC